MKEATIADAPNAPMYPDALEDTMAMAISQAMKYAVETMAKGEDRSNYVEGRKRRVE